jgi:response regulator RpfG family c-di-GMP phosphodiesterase
MQGTVDRTILVVDDDETMRAYLSDTLGSAGYGCVSFSSGAAAIGWMASETKSPDLLLSDITMPGMSGLDLLRTVRTLVPQLPIILISGLCDLPTAQGALRAGATDYLLKPVRPADLLEIVSKHTHVVRSEHLEEVKEALRLSLGTRDSSEGNQAGQLLPIFESLGLKRIETLQHSQRVAAYALLIGHHLGLDRAELRALELGSLLHDIGKAGIPRNVLLKRAKLTDAEWVIMKMHPQLGLDLLHGLPGLEGESELVYSHQERFDGRGYPRNLAGENIALNARVFSVADSLDAITSNRSYRPAQALAAARVEIHRVAGTQLDPALVKLFDHVTDAEVDAVRGQFPDVV